jgi:hypothetical protein
MQRVSHEAGELAGQRHALQQDLQLRDGWRLHSRVMPRTAAGETGRYQFGSKFTPFFEVT